VLDLVEARVPLNIEIKSAGGTAARVASVLREALSDGWSPSQFLVSSFHLPELYEFKQAAPEIPIAALVCGVPLDWAACAVELGAQALNVSAEFADARLLHDAHERGIKMYVYTVNHPDDIRLLRDAGFDGVFSDYPDRVLAAR
jgi:glycerophosphoryl diester phosphodiesterase